MSELCSSGRQQRGFTGTFEIVGADKAGGGHRKKETQRAGAIACRPYHTVGHSWLPDLPSPPYLPKGVRGQGYGGQLLCWSMTTQRLNRVREAHARASGHMPRHTRPVLPPPTSEGLFRTRGLQRASRAACRPPRGLVSWPRLH